MSTDYDAWRTTPPETFVCARCERERREDDLDDSGEPVCVECSDEETE